MLWIAERPRDAGRSGSQNESPLAVHPHRAARQFRLSDETGVAKRKIVSDAHS